MSTEADPIVGNWYAHLDKGQLFEVVALDEEEATVEVQYFDGAVEEMDLEQWYELEVEPSDPPEDYTGPMDDVETDDLGYSDTEMEEADWREGLQEVHDKETQGLQVPEGPGEPEDEASAIDIEEGEEEEED